MRAYEMLVNPLISGIKELVRCFKMWSPEEIRAPATTEDGPESSK